MVDSRADQMAGSMVVLSADLWAAKKVDYSAVCWVVQMVVQMADQTVGR